MNAMRPLQPASNVHAVLLALVCISLGACANSGQVLPGQGVNVGDASQIRKIVPAEDLEQSAATQYAGLVQELSPCGSAP